MTHRLKIRQCFAQAIISGEKTFEIRYNGDRGFQRGDHVVFAEICEDGCINTAAQINKKRYEITYVLGGFGLQQDYVVFGIKEVQKDG